MALGTVNVGAAPIDNSGSVSQEQVGAPGGIATLGGDGKLTASQVPAIDAYTKAATDSKVSGAVSTHNADQTTHGDIRASVADVAMSVQALELKYGTNVTANAFAVSFASLGDVEVTGVWNASQSRIEF